jgi:PmbA protein
MREATEALEYAEKVLALLPKGLTGDVRVSGHRFGTMRFAVGRIHQPHLESETLVSLRVARDRQIATATTTDLSDLGLRELVRDASALAATAPVEEHFPGFPGPDGKKARANAFSSATAQMAPEAQGKLAQRALDAAQAAQPGSRVSGVLNVGVEWLAVANTSALARSDIRTVSQASVLVERPERDPPVSGWAEGADWDARRLDTAALGKEAAERVAATAPKSVPPGKYRVLLGGCAVAELLSFLGHLGFGGNPEVEGWSCLARKRGKRVAPAGMTVVDDATQTLTLPQAIDFEGAWKRRTPLLEDGVARPAVTDLVTAGRLGREPSGHALPPESPWGDYGPIPSHQVMDAGDGSDSELVRETKNGLLVTRFHYVRVVHPGKSTITGMTRDGTYEIRDGEIADPVRNLRFTESILGTLASAELWGRTRRRYADERGFTTVTCPALVASEFRFTSATLF